MINDVMRFLWTQTLTFSVLCFVVLVLRPAIRKVLGVRAGYQLWLVLPCALVAQFLPAPPQEIFLATILNTETVFKQIQVNTIHDSFPLSSFLVGIWLFGLVATAVFFFLQHHFFIRKLGPLLPRNGYFVSETQITGPALVGLWHPIIVMPLRFERDFDDRERMLMLTHEQTHQLRHDPFFNLLCAILLGIWWFHPLAHFAASRYRYDQELACDAVVLSRFPQFKRIYADALLKVSGHFQAGIIHCHFPHQPLRKRIMEIFKSENSRSTRVFAQLISASLIALASYATWANNPKSDATTKIETASKAENAKFAYLLNTEIDFGGSTSAPRILLREGQLASIYLDEKGARWEVGFLVTSKTPGAESEKLSIKITAKKNQEEAVNATLNLGMNEQGGVRISDPEKHLQFNLRLSASKQTTKTGQAPKVGGDQAD